MHSATKFEYLPVPPGLNNLAGAHRSKITKKVHKPPQNHYIEWPVFFDIGLNCESQGDDTSSPFFTRVSAKVKREVCEPFRQF